MTVQLITTTADRFVPDETSFEGDAVHDEATESSVAAEGAAYQGIDFVTDALRHSKVKLTWDADDPHRKSKIQSFMLAATDSKTKGKGGKKDLNADDIKAYLASSSDEDGDDAEANEAEEQDDFFEASSTVDKKAKGKAVSKRDKLRSIFGLDGSGQGLEDQAWDGSSLAGKGAKGRGGEGEMQITFAPALSTKKKAVESDDGDEENALETYKRKEKERRERKRLERQQRKNGGQPVAEGPEFGGEDTGPGGFDDDFFADDGGDPFAAFDEGGADSGDEIGLGQSKKKNGKMSKAERRKAKEAEEEAAKAEQAELALLVGSDEDDQLGGGRHFDMRAILKAEKNAGKKGRSAKKGKRKAGDESTGANDVPKDTFEIDLKDDRFKSLHEDYDFAIDPTNPRFQKTRNMTALLGEGRKRRAKGHDARAPVGAPSVAGSKPKHAADEGDLLKLVESVKRKAGETGGRGKRTKT